MDLLDILAERMGCTSLSDLRYISKNNQQLHQIVNSIPLSSYSEKEWIAAAKYICDVSCFETSAARQALMRV